MQREYPRIESGTFGKGIQDAACERGLDCSSNNHKMCPEVSEMKFKGYACLYNWPNMLS